MAHEGIQDPKLPILSQQLLLSVAEEIKMPLLKIARLAEYNSLAAAADRHEADNVIRATAESALHLIDNYILGVRLALEPQIFDAESVSVSSVLYDSCQQLDALAKSYGVGLEIDIAGKFGSVTANRKGLQAALVSLGASLIEALPALESSQLKLQLATHKTRYGVVAGVYSDTPQVSAQAIRSGRKLQQNTRQPFIGMSHNSGAGIFVADTLLRSMNLKLMTSRHHKKFGIGTVLQLNNQLQLV
ncbi:MAG TPA: hypothetical protein VFN51_01095 [Candidatus Saccharimonadales bacterium]|nr:hypothetical protein [Candidatus Saccharimonadales bacterium]